ncbi:MAG TPA: PKD domain-containing protein, partial [Bacteroidales bacterium]|nr:PKD domain-containing protein [Bacteroidales bacterium]
ISHAWDFRDPTSGIENTSNTQDPLHVFANPGSYLVKLTITNYNNCIDTISKQVVVKASPSVDFAVPAACLNTPAGFAPDLAITNVATISSWFWDFGDGNTSPAQNPSNTYAASGTYTVKLTVTDITGCKKTVSHNIVIDPSPTAHFSAPLSVCAGAAADFQNLSTPATGYITQWQWNFGDGNIQVVNHPGNPDISHAYALPNSYIVTLKVTGSNGCSSSKSQAITVRPNPLANFDFTPACVGTPVSFSDLSQTNGAGAVTTFSWEFDDAGSGILNSSDIQNPDHEFVASGNHTVRMIITASNTCSDTISKTITVKTAPAVDFTASNTCQGNPVSFSPDASVMNIAAVGSWLWEFGSGNTSVLSNPAYVFPTAGNQQVKLTITDNSGCSNSITKPVTIIAKPVVKFWFQQPVCSQSAVLFNNISDATPGTVLSSTWDFGDGNTKTVSALTAVSHKYVLPGAYNVKLTITTSDGCTNSTSLPVLISQEPTANFNVQASCLNSPVQFTDLSVAGSGAVTSWNWNFGEAVSGSNTAVIQHPSHTYTAPGIYQVTLIVSNNGGC